MRINVYEEELTAEVKLVTKTVPQKVPVMKEDDQGFRSYVDHYEDGEQTFYGLRLFLESPQSILDHSTPEDDDRNAITFWVRPDGETGLQFLESVLRRMLSRVEYERIELGQRGPSARIQVRDSCGEVVGDWMRAGDGTVVVPPQDV